MPQAQLKALRVALDDFLQTRELEDGRELPPDAPGLEERRTQLNAAFWAAAREIIEEAGVDGSLRLDDEARTLLDFGLLTAPALEEPARRLDTGEEVDGVLLLHESLQAVLDDVRRREVIDEL